MDYNILPVQIGNGQKLAAILHLQPDEGRSQGDWNHSENMMDEVLAIADNEQELHERVQKRNGKKISGRK